MYAIRSYYGQYRHATSGELLELPAGTLEENEDPEVCAAREIREETGKAADKLTKLGEFSYNFV